MQPQNAPSSLGVVGVALLIAGELMLRMMVTALGVLAIYAVI